jgi:hypothetical protein
MKNVNDIINRPEYRCPVCGERRYITDQDSHELTLHCSAPEARFWEFERDTLVQTIAKQHWDQSRLDVFLSLDGVLSNVK